ncbi:MAG: hypothetical protein NTZ25_05425 [Candidatus Peregrinibacteria bacterium]|nr:hypothetical protein [Candidatus Peregrinibacteria bacterium]
MSETEDREHEQPESPIFDPSRMAPGADAAQFLEELRQLQIPCPWGDLTKGAGFVKFPHPISYMPDMEVLPYVPLALTLGSGMSPHDAQCRGFIPTYQFGKLIHSDIIEPRVGPKNYLRMDLRDPENINLGGFKVHALMSQAVFTYDGLGVNFRGRENEIAVAKALSNLLMPGGIIINNNVGPNIFEEILMKECGFKYVKEDSAFGAVMLQKPFE